MRRSLVPYLASLLLVLSAACGDRAGAESPEVALDRLRRAVAAEDGPAVYELYDTESQGYYRDQVRLWRAAVEGGRPVGEVLPESLDWSQDRLLAGTAEDATARLLGRHSSFALLADWFQDAVIVDREDAAPGEARLDLEGPDGRVRSIWFVLESRGWAYDHYRSRW